MKMADLLPRIVQPFTFKCEEDAFYTGKFILWTMNENTLKFTIFYLSNHSLLFPCEK